MAPRCGRSTWSLDGMRAFVTAFLIVGVPAPASAVDACAAAIPAPLGAELLNRFGDYRLPRESDNLQEDIDYAREHSKRSCLSVASADLDGDGSVDYVVTLTAKKGDGWLVVAALARGTAWAIFRLEGADSGRSNRYVDVASPGTYDDVVNYESPREKGAVDHLTCPHSVAIAGASEASAVAYCRLKAGWKHVWVMD